jgi:UDPglucose--hexose-1-phosphate uridylyltransferase
MAATCSQLQALVLFRNHGSRAGTSLSHPHSQLVATSIVPQALRRRELLTKEYYEQHRRCLLCDLMQIEQRQQVRLIDDNREFLAFVPFAASVPCEMWLVPRRHESDFMRITQVQKEALSRILRRVLRSLRDKLGDPHYNMIFHLPSRVESGSPFNHWFLQIRPRMTTPAGFEIGSGMTINPSLPEDDAHRLRQCS